MAKYVVFTQSYPSTKNKNGKYPAHVLDIIDPDILNYYNMQEKYASILDPATNFKYDIQWSELLTFNEYHEPTGRKRYKKVP